MRNITPTISIALLPGCATRSALRSAPSDADAEVVTAVPFEKAVAARLKQVPDAPVVTNDAALRERIKALIVQCTRLKIVPSEIKDDPPLVDPASGLSLDSIDALERVVGLEKNYGVTTPDRDTGRRVLRSVTTIAEFVKASGRTP